MTEIAEPASEQDISEIVRAACAERTPLQIQGGGTRSAIGRPVQAARVLSMKGHSGVTLHEPGALTLIARAGTLVSEVQAVLKAEGQCLAFEPIDHRGLLGETGEPTIGAVVAGNHSGPRRIKAGACRDSLIGVRLVDGGGEVIKNGGRVMKNVTGYDLTKLMCGAWGTLGVLTEVAFKVLPAAPREATVLIAGLDAAQAVAAMSSALGSPYDVTGAAWLPDRGVLIRVEGFDAQLDYRLGQVAGLPALAGDQTVLEGPDHDALWRAVRDVGPFHGRSNPVWRISAKPSDAPAIDAALRAEAGAETFFDWGGGLIWAELPDRDDAGAEAVRGVVARIGGHATLIRASAAIRAAVEVFHPEPARIAAISETLRRKFDPAGVLNPGKMRA